MLTELNMIHILYTYLNKCNKYKKNQLSFFIQMKKHL